LIIVDASVVVDLLIKPPAEVAHIKARLAGGTPGWPGSRGTGPRSS
jgi:hypothetical protein